MSKKSQAAMEFLMTYWWAILLVVVVISVLVYSGFFDIDNVRKRMPGECEMGSVLECVDFIVYDTKLHLIIRNVYTNQLNLSDIRIAGCEQVRLYPNSVLKPGEERDYVFIGCNFDKDFIGESINALYRIQYGDSSGPEHTISGIIKSSIAHDHITSVEIGDTNIVNACMIAELSYARKEDRLLMCSFLNQSYTDLFEQYCCPLDRCSGPNWPGDCYCCGIYN